MRDKIIIMNGHEFEEQTYYVIEVAMTPNNPIFQDIFFTEYPEYLI